MRPKRRFTLIFACGAIGKTVGPFHNTRSGRKYTGCLALDNYKNLYKAVSIAICIVLQGCAMTYGPDHQERDEFQRRVEAAFRLQNRMTSELMLIQSDGSDLKEHAPIIHAEQEMEKQCRYLNEYAALDIDGLNKSLLLLKRVESSVAECEQSARLVEKLLKTHQR